MTIGKQNFARALAMRLSEDGADFQACIDATGEYGIQYFDGHYEYKSEKFNPELVVGKANVSASKLQEVGKFVRYLRSFRTSEIAQILQ